VDKEYAKRKKISYTLGEYFPLIFMDSFFPSDSLAEQIVHQYGTPVFVTNKEYLETRARQILEAFAWKKKKILYAIKANFNPKVVQTLLKSGIHGIDAVSVYEVELALSLGVSPQNITFTGSNPSNEQLQFVVNHGVLVNAGSLSEIERMGKMFSGNDIAIRINPGVGAGLFAKNITGGKESKFGILREDFSQAKELLKKYSLRLVGIHAHVGSGFYNTTEFLQSAKILLHEAEEFPDLDFVDFGGGFVVPYRPQETAVNLAEFGQGIQKLLEDFSLKNGRDIEMRIQPGRFLVAESTCLLARVTTVKQSGGKTFIGLDTGMNHLVRPAMYDSYHHIVNVSNMGGEKIVADVVGNICESGDFFAKNRAMSETKEGDLLAILTAGAYGSSMSSNYNLFPFAVEVIVDGEEIVLTRKRQSLENILDSFVL
jgi:diaminopimelate decarboxylase